MKTSQKTNTKLWCKNLDITGEDRISYASSLVVVQAELMLENCQYNQLLVLVKNALEHGSNNTEERVVLHCLLNEVLCGMSRYEEAAEVLSGYESNYSLLPDKLQAELFLRIGATCVMLRQTSKAITKLTEAIRIFPALGNSKGVIRCYCELSLAYIYLNEYDIARDYLMRTLAATETANDWRLMGSALMRLGAVEHYDGNFALAEYNLCQALKIVEDRPDSRLLGSIYMNLASNTLFLKEHGSTEQVRANYEKAIEYFQHLDNCDLLAHCYVNIGDYLLRLGKWKESQNASELAIKHAQKAKDSYREGLARITLGELHLYYGKSTVAKRYLYDAINIFEQKDRSVLAHAKRILGYTYKEGSKAAFKAFDSSLRLALAVGDHDEITFSQLALAEYYLVCRESQQTHKFLKQAQERLNHKPSPYISGFMQRLMGRLKVVDNQLSEAIENIMVSIAIFTALGDCYEVSRSNLELSVVLMKHGQLDKAQIHVREAISTFGKLQANAELGKAKRLQEVINNQMHNNPPISPQQFDTKSDISLLRRLGQACLTSETLLQEFVSTMKEAFSLTKLFVFQCTNGTPKLLIGYGSSYEEALHKFQAFELAKCHNYLKLNGGVLFKIACDSQAELYSYFEFVAGELAEHSLMRIEFFVEFLKLGLEKCHAQDWSSSNTTITAPETDRTIPGLIYTSSAMNHIVNQIKKIRTSNVTVLVTGESGTGKELIAHAIHDGSTRREHPFIAFNCTATPNGLLESQLFGHRRGSFTGATNNYPGVIRAAKGGTLFLDEIGDLSLEAQPKLLRFLEQGEIQPLGETNPVKIDVRIVAATNTDLNKLVDQHRFREDLYYRLNIINIRIPPLRERAEDIPLLVKHYLVQLSTRYNSRMLTISSSAMEVLQGYSWPGNVRQLRNEVERLFTYASTETISAMEISENIRKSIKLTVIPTSQNVFVNKPSILTPAPVNNGEVVKFRDMFNPFEMDLIITALENNKWNISHTAKELGVSRRGLRLKIKRLGICAGIKPNSA